MHVDRLISTFDTGLRTLFVKPIAARTRPDAHLDSTDLTDADKLLAARLMRINHVGEVCAQALYSGQAITSRNQQVVDSLRHAAVEETDHLAWCEDRMVELGGRKSLLNPVWFLGSFTLGVAAGAIGDKWNLGFLSETEQQVSAHLASHLDKLSQADVKTRAIITQMEIDEREHADTAKQLGAAELPDVVKFGMKLMSKVMTKIAYYV